jgi:uncharacterized protein (TIGR03382 family)
MKRVSKVSIVLACFGVAALAVPVAYAHFNLMQPTNWLVQNATGDPQKTPPCGNEGTNQTNAVTTYKVGGTVAITINETVFHPGHYRVSLAASQAALPPDPQLTDCNSLPITQNPTLPLLADGLLVHTTAFTAPQTVQVSLPAGMTCDHCVLQIQEFMQSHPVPCFYHHCATINITQDGTPPPPAATDAGVNGDAATGGNGGNPGTGGTTGGGCDAGGHGSSGAAGLVFAVALALSRRRS